MGKILYIDLTNRSRREDSIDENILREYLGGCGLGARLLYDMTDSSTNPLGPENVVIFATGPLTGSGVYNSDRFDAVTKSPLTGIFAESSCGGYWGGKLKRSGYDALVISGESDTPLYVYIDESTVDICEGSEYWGRDTYETTDMLKEKYGSHAEVAVIGQAGENCVLYANVVTAGVHGRVVGRGGFGAVLGSKKLKAVVVNGKLNVDIYDPDALSNLKKSVTEEMKEGPDILRQHGTAVHLETYNEIGELPIRNWHQGKWTEGAVKISGMKLTEDLLLKRYNCRDCIIRCGRVVKGVEGPYKGRIMAGPEYETIAMFGSNCMIDDLKILVKVNELCNRYGMDSVSAGSSIAFALEAYERGLLNKTDFHGIDAQWGNGKSILELIKAIALGEGIGCLLGKGTRKMSEEIGGIAPEFAVHVKGLEAPAHDPRAKFGLALSYATSARGACHVSAFIMDFDGGIVIDDLGLPEISDRFATENKALAVKMMQDWMGIYDSACLCKFCIFGGQTPSFVAKAVSAVTGWEINKKELMKIGSRIFTMKRMYNNREGISRKDDVLPPRFTFQRKGGGTDKLPPIPEMLDSYYEIRGWDELGIPKEETLSLLNLKQ